MALIEIKWNPTARELRVFGILLFLIFGLFGAWLIWEGNSLALVASVSAIALFGGILGAMWPEFLRPLYRLWMALVFPVGWVVSHLILALVFFCILTPIGLMMRLTGHDPLKLKYDRQRASYWSERPAQADDSRYFRQF